MFFQQPLGTTAEKFYTLIRLHWAIENNLHWRLDVSFNEVKQQRKKDHEGENMNMLCKMTFNILKLDTENKKTLLEGLNFIV
ncbi:hypothetical protein K4L44_09795 [Halosquirtibacter laminarini]|uniref:Uncharacterized protein n=1 Tax=Halosquirtibacter laminarini TaxID=3374600 RepID=A0AC61NBP4_9BACT|nr:hypothetical protein K4L44_09795 [Prolixibacteraceae bacterium]